MPSLRLHMFRVAAVAKIILSHLREPLSTEEEQHVISACLLHDMGNIVKFNLLRFPEFLKPEGLEYWQEVQKKFWEKYGHEQHDIHHKIAEEIGIHSRTIELINAVGVKKTCSNSQSSDIAKKICSYADARAAPYGIVSLTERIKETIIRYKDSRPQNENNFHLKAHDCLYEIEKQLFSLTDISPEQITEENVASSISLFQEYVPV